MQAKIWSEITKSLHLVQIAIQQVQVVGCCICWYLKASQQEQLARFGSSFDTHTTNTTDAITLSAIHAIQNH